MLYDEIREAIKKLTGIRFNEISIDNGVYAFSFPNRNCLLLAFLEVPKVLMKHNWNEDDIPEGTDIAIRISPEYDQYWITYTDTSE